MKRNKLQILYIAILCMSVLAGCATQSTLKSVSACKIGCSSGETEIRDINRSRSIPPIHSWTAICNNKVYYCSGNLEQSTCVLKEEPVQSKPFINGYSDEKKLVMSFQNALNDMGFDAGPVDGILGKKTRIAIELFQHEKKLPVTGRIDMATKKALLGI
jgi:hypothetical protein